MQTWYECKVKYLKIDQGGFERKVNDNYLLDAVSFTDAESRIFKQMRELTNGEFQVMNIKKSNISEVIANKDGEWWYKAKISLITIDEEAGKEKKITNYVLVMADDINDGLSELQKGLEYMLVPYAVTAIQLSTIAEVFPYDSELEDKVVENNVESQEPDQNDTDESDDEIIEDKE